MKPCRTGDEICIPTSKLPRVVVIGGGFAGVSFIKKLKKIPVQVVLLDHNNFHQFQPLLYQVATCGLEPDSIGFPLRKLFNKNRNTFFRMAKVMAVNTEINTITTDIGAVEYDLLVIATGCSTNFFGLKDMQENSIGIKNIQEALDIRNMILQNLEKAVNTCDETEKNSLTNFVIIGGGPTGVEITGAMAEFKKYILPKDYPELDSSSMNIYLIESHEKLLKSMSDNSSKNALKYLMDMGVDVKLNTHVKSYDGYTITTDRNDLLYAKTVIWTAGVKANTLEGIKKESLTTENRIWVDDFLRVKGHQNVYAIGDISVIISDKYPRGHPMVAQVAIQQGKLLAENIASHLNQKKPKPFKYMDKGSLATIGKRKAVADIGMFKFSGYFAWLIWSFIHLVSISGFRNKLLVGVDWVSSYFSYDKGNRLILKKYTNKNKILFEKETKAVIQEDSVMI